MTKLTALLLACFSTVYCFSQMPTITLSGQENNSVKLQDLKINVQVLGNIAQVKMNMVFCNSSAKILEGELNFPMPDGVSVSHYALDINGKLRSAVVVENQKAKQVFESIERRRVDPGLLEKTEGNNYRTRIYPLPANGCRTIEIGYNQVLTADEKNNFKFLLPLQYAEKLKTLGVNVDVVGASEIPETDASNGQNLVFQQNNQIWHSALNLSNTEIKKGIAFSIQNKNATTQSVMQETEGNNYFLINPTLNITSKNKIKPNKISILWDVSLSSLDRNRTAEIELIKQYLTWIGNVDVQLITFNQNIKTNTHFKIEQGNSNALFAFLSNQIIDGGTSYDDLEKTIDRTDEVLFFSDGQNNLGTKVKFYAKKIPFYAIVSSPKSNLESLKTICYSTGGDIIQLNNQSTEKAIVSLTHQKLYFLGYKNNDEVHDVYPSTAKPVGTGFQIVGVSAANNTNIVLLFGYNNQASIEVPVSLQLLPKNNTNYGLDRIWAQEKIAELETEFPVDKNLVIALGKKYTIVTHGTSLMVLETVNDYVLYDIEPPVELRTEWLALKKEQRNNNILEQNNKTDFVPEWKSFLTWYAKDFHPTSVFGKNTTTTAANPPITPAPTQASTGNNREVSSPAHNQVTSQESNSQNVRIRGISSLPKRDEGPALKGKIAGVEVRRSDESLDDVVVSGYDRPKKIITSASVSISSNELDHNKSDISKTPTNQNVDDDFRNRPSDSLILIPTQKVETIEESIKILSAVPNNEKYKKYLGIRLNFIDNADFYFQVSQYFAAQKMNEEAFTIISNIAELSLENADLYKALGFSLMYMQKTKEAQQIFTKVSQWRSFEPQSFRDLGLALLANKQYQAAADTLFYALKVLSKTDRGSAFEGMETTLILEINSILKNHPEVHLKNFNKEYTKQAVPLDLSIVLNWNRNDTDNDLYVTDPNGEVCYYSKKETPNGAMFINDQTNGYGPEQVVVKKAMKGKYKIKVHFYGSSNFKGFNTSSIFIQATTHAGQSNENTTYFCNQLIANNTSDIELGTIEVK